MRDRLPRPEAHLTGLGGFEEKIARASGSGCELGNEEGAAVRATELELERRPGLLLGRGCATKSWIQVDAERIELAGEFPVVEVREETVVENQPAGIGGAE
jgi:hypothetical protein